MTQNRSTALLGAVAAIVVGALFFRVPVAHAIPTPFTDAFCGPLAEGGCGDGQKIFLDNAKAQTTLTGNVNANNHGPVVKITSDHNMMLVATLDSGGGFATITPGGKADFFSGIDVSIPGFEFTGLIFSVQMQPTANQVGTTDPLTIDGFRGTGASRLADLISPIETAKTDQDREFSITAVGGLGLFDDVDIFSTTGFKEIKHLKIEGLCQILASGGCQPLIVDAAEPASFALLGLGMVALGAIRRRAAARRLLGSALRPA
jgi:hypothetical protein